ncbi:MAG: NAD-dependent epimerase/dehydratase family protein [Myxococcota bacterium]|jgi:dihydroflavonol-4-reductase|nr:NAD-dependent epimerase/dehydratase family protein [Myxococcota bacterium]
MKGLRALVLGGTGFLGLNIVEALQAGGHDVLIGRRKRSNTIIARRFKLPLVLTELEEPETLLEAMRGRDVVFMSAGHYPRYSIDTEAQVQAAVEGLRHALIAARSARVRRLVFTSSVVTVAPPKEERPARESDGTLARAPDGSTYYAVKLALEQEALSAMPELEVVVTLPTGCMGLYDHKVGTGHFVLAMAARKLSAFVDGRTNIVDAADVAQGHVAAAVHGAPGERYILGGENLRVRQLLERMSNQFDAPMPMRELSPAEALAWAEEEEARCIQSRARPAMTREMVDMALHGLFVESKKAIEELGFSTRSLSETLQRSLNWYKKNGYFSRPL